VNVTATDRARPTPRRRSDGEQSHAAILEAAARLATVEGIDALSIGRLADAVGMSKSGLFAHFGSKEELQLATVDRAMSTFRERVLEAADAAPPGLPRLQSLVEGYLGYVAADTFPGGCFFASVLAEVDMQQGPVRDRVLGFLTDWMSRLEEAVREGQARGEIDADQDAAQLRFEVQAALFLGNAQYVVSREQEPLERARRAIDRSLSHAVPPRRQSRARRQRG